MDRATIEEVSLVSSWILTVCFNDILLFTTKLSIEITFSTLNYKIVQMCLWMYERHTTYYFIQWSSLFMLALRLLSAHYRTTMAVPFPTPGQHLVCNFIQLLYLNVYQNLCWVYCCCYGCRKYIFSTLLPWGHNSLPYSLSLMNVAVRPVLALCSGFPNKANSPGRLSSWFYHPSKDHLQYLHTFQRKGWGEHGSMWS